MRATSLSHCDGLAQRQWVSRWGGAVRQWFTAGRVVADPVVEGSGERVPLVRWPAVGPLARLGLGVGELADAVVCPLETTVPVVVLMPLTHAA